MSPAARKSADKRVRLAVKLEAIEAAALRHMKADEEAEARRLLQVIFLVDIVSSAIITSFLTLLVRV